jgi:hypothetical protein
MFPLMMRLRRKLLDITEVPPKDTLPLASVTMLAVADEAF